MRNVDAWRSVSTNSRRRILIGADVAASTSGTILGASFIVTDSDAQDEEAVALFEGAPSIEHIYGSDLETSQDKQTGLWQRMDSVNEHGLKELSVFKQLENRMRRAIPEHWEEYARDSIGLTEKLIPLVVDRNDVDVPTSAVYLLRGVPGIRLKIEHSVSNPQRPTLSASLQGGDWIHIPTHSSDDPYDKIFKAKGFSDFWHVLAHDEAHTDTRNQGH